MIFLEHIHGQTYEAKIPVLKKGTPRTFSLVHSATQQSFLFDVIDYHTTSGLIAFNITFESLPFSGQYNYVLYSDSKKLSEGLCSLQVDGSQELVSDDFYFDYEAVPSKEAFVSDAKITFVDEDGKVIGDISVNQFDDETIVIKQKEPEVHWNDILDKPTIGEGTVSVYSGETLLGTINLNSDENTLITIPTPNNAEITLMNGNTELGHFSLNQLADTTINIPIPSKTSDLTNDSNFITTETDPVFTQSPAGTITDEDIANWNAKGSSNFSGDYNDLSNRPTIGDGTITIQKNGTTLNSFSLNDSTSKSIDIVVPTKTSDLTNDSNFSTFSGSYDDLSNKPTIPSVGNGTITIQKNSTTIDSFGLNDSADKAINIEVPEKISDLEDDINILTQDDFNDTAASEITSEDIANWNAKGSSNFSGDYNDLSNKPTIPTVNNATVTIKEGNTTKGTFTLNQNSNSTITLTDHVALSQAEYDALEEIDPDVVYIITDPISWNDLADKPTIPTVNNGTITIQKNSTTIDSFGLNDSTSKTINIVVPTKTSDLTNDSNFSTFSGSYNDLSDKPTIPSVGNGTVTIMQGNVSLGTFTMNQSGNTTITIPEVQDHVTLTQAEYDALEEIDPEVVYLITDPISWNDLADKPTIPTVNNGTITIQKNGTTVDSFGLNDSADKTINIVVPTKTSDLTNDSNFSTFSGSYNDLSNKPTIPSVWKGTLAEYNAIATKDQNTIYIITDQSQQYTVYDSTITLKNGSQILGYFTLNQSQSTEIDLAPMLTWDNYSS